MNFDEIIATITPETFEMLKRALELGKWQNGVALTDEQKAYCMQAVIAYSERNLPEEERIGYIDRGSKKDSPTCGDPRTNAAKGFNPTDPSSSPASGNDSAVKYWQ